MEIYVEQPSEKTLYLSMNEKEMKCLISDLEWMKKNHSLREPIEVLLNTLKDK